MHWVIDEDEADQIAKPLAGMLNKMNKKRKDSIGNMMTPMLLITAVGAVVVPRVMITLAEWKEKRTNARNTNRAYARGSDPNKAVTGSGGVAPEAAGTDQRTVIESTDDGKGSNHSIPTVPAEVRSALAFGDQ